MTRTIGALLLLAGLGFFGYETVAHEMRDRLVLYGSLGLAGAGLVLLGFADEIAAGLAQIGGALRPLLPWGKKDGEA